MRTLIVEDEQRVADFLLRGLLAEGHTCAHAKTGKEGLRFGLEGEFDLILLDMRLPEMHGRDVCAELRKRKVSTPIIILSAMDAVEDVVSGLHAGADDYLTKPFRFDELFARIDAVLRRNQGDQSHADELKFAGIKIDRKSYRVYVDDEEIKMTAKEYAILELMMNNPDRLYSREYILNTVWGLDKDPLTNVVDVYIGKLRKKLSRGGSDSVIETVRGFGYRLQAH